MTRIISALAFLVFTFQLSDAQTYFEDFEDQVANQKWKTYRLGASDPSYKWDFSGLAYSGSYALYHYYPVGGASVTDDWKVSPKIDFGAGGTIDSLWAKFSGFGAPLTEDTVAIYLLQGSQNPDSAVSKTLLHIYVDSIYSSDGIWRATLNVPIPATQGDAFIAFRYKTTNNWLDVAFDDLSITQSLGDYVAKSLDEISLKLSPNPAIDFINIDSKHLIQSVKLFNMHGSLIKSCDPSLERFDLTGILRGMYLFEIKAENRYYIEQMIKM